MADARPAVELVAESQESQSFGDEPFFRPVDGGDVGGDGLGAVERLGKQDVAVAGLGLAAVGLGDDEVGFREVLGDPGDGAEVVDFHLCCFGGG